MIFYSIKNMETKTVKINSEDNVEVALVNLNKNEPIINNGSSFVLQTDIPAKHKFALKDIEAGVKILCSVIADCIEKPELLAAQDTDYQGLYK